VEYIAADEDYTAAEKFLDHSGENDRFNERFQAVLDCYVSELIAFGFEASAELRLKLDDEVWVINGRFKKDLT